MNPHLAPLIDLQKLDLRIAELKEQRRKIPERLELSEAPLREVTRACQTASTAVDALVKERRSHEKDLEAHEDRIAKMKDRASQLKTNQEYQAHLFEVELAGKKRGEIEEKILLAMEQIEQIQRTLAEAQAKLKDSQAAFAKDKAVLDELDRTVTAELTEVTAKQAALSATIEKSLLARYNKLKTTRKDQALVLIKDGICLGCRLQLPPQLVSQVKRVDDVHACPYCYRLLYWEGAQAAGDAKPSPEQTKPADLELGESL